MKNIVNPPCVKHGEELAEAIELLAAGQVGSRYIYDDHAEGVAALDEKLTAAVQKHSWNNLCAALTLLQGWYYGDWEKRDLIGLMCGAGTKAELLTLMADAGELFGDYYRLMLKIGG